MSVDGVDVVQEAGDVRHLLPEKAKSAGPGLRIGGGAVPDRAPFDVHIALGQIARRVERRGRNDDLVTERLQAGRQA